MLVGFFITGFLLLGGSMFALVVPPIFLAIALFFDYKILVKDFGTRKTILILSSYIAFAALLIFAYVTENPIFAGIIDGMYRLFGVN